MTPSSFSRPEEQPLLPMSGPDESKLKPTARQILALLRRGWVTPLIALDEVGTTEFRKRVSEIRQAGFKLEFQMVPRDGGRPVKAWRVPPLGR